MVIDRLDMPVEPPYAAGSTRSGALMTSSDPTIVGVDSAGNLIAHRNGEALIRTNGGAALNCLFLRTRFIGRRPIQTLPQPLVSQSKQA
jgi:hypothetical protein